MTWLLPNFHEAG